MPHSTLQRGRPLRLLALAIVSAVLLSAAGPAAAERQVPVGLFGMANHPIRAGHDQLALRFVLDRPTTMSRFITGFNLEGVYTDGAGRQAPVEVRTGYRSKRGAPGGDPLYPPPPADLPAGWTPGDGRVGYSHGDGGTIHARLVRVKPTGEPDLSQVLGQEKVGAVRRYRQSKAAYGIPSGELTQLLYFDVGPIRLQANTMYAVVITNAHPRPATNYFSVNLPATRRSVAGPNGRNTLDPRKPGAVAGLDPRETTAWSRDRGRSWAWGTDVGSVLDGPDLFGYYGGSSTRDDGPVLPWYGWQSSPRARPRSNQPYFAYGESGSYTLVAHRVPRSVTLTRAGGYAPVGERVGTVTVRNLATGATGRVRGLGGGLAQGRLDDPVRVGRGQSYSIASSGSVLKAEADGFIRSTFGVGRGNWSFSTSGNGDDRAELFALPHPWFGPRLRRPVSLRARPARRRRIASRTSRSRRAAVRVRGAVARRYLRAAHGRVRIQTRGRGRWRTAARLRLRRGGRFRGRLRVRVPRGRRAVRLRAVVLGAGRSASVRVRLR